MNGGNQYRANAFTPQTGVQVQAGNLSVSADRIHFESESIRGDLPLNGMQARRGGHNDEQIFFEHADRPGWTVYSSDPALANDPVLSNHPAFRDLLKAYGRSRRSSTPAILLAGTALLALLCGLLLVLWLVKDPIADFVAGKIPLAWEEKLGEQVFQQTTREGKIITSSQWDEPLKKITDRLEKVVEDSGYTFQFHVMQDTNVNAFAIPGGHVVILTGLLESAETPEEVAGVLAHELAHVTRRHSLRNMVKSAGLIILIQAAFGDASGLLTVAAEGSRFLLQQKFSRDFEREADETGWTYLTEAKIDPRGMIRFFKKLQMNQQNAGMGAMEGSLSLLNTHPASQERIDRLEEKWEGTTTKTGFNDLGSWTRKP